MIDHADVLVKARLTACEVPWAVAEAFAGAVAEALTNVARHSGAGEATVEMSADTEITVEVADEGRGFDVTALPAHRFGVRESIEGRWPRWRARPRSPPAWPDCCAAEVGTR